MGIDYGFEVGIGLQLDEEICEKIIERFELDVEDENVIEFIADNFYFKEFEHNPITTFSTGDFVCDYDVKHWIGINLEAFDLKYLEEILNNKSDIEMWFKDFGLSVKWEQLEFIKEIRIS